MAKIVLIRTRGEGGSKNPIFTRTYYLDVPLVEVTVKCMPGLVRDSYLSLYDLHPPPEVPGWSDEVSRSYHSPPL